MNHFDNVRYLIENEKALTILFYLEKTSEKNRKSLIKIEKDFNLPNITKKVLDQLTLKQLICLKDKSYYISNKGITALELIVSI